jgi:site-specific recombinase XerD
MASLYKRDRSPFWWVAFEDEEKGKRVWKSTGFRINDPIEHRKARSLEAELTARERKRTTHGAEEKWESWVGPFLKRHCKTAATYGRYNLGWSWVRTYLHEKRLLTPAAVTYRDALGYLEWRTSFKKKRGKSVQKNTALNDMKTFRIIMRQAVRLGFCPGNPCDRLGVEKDEVKEKPALTDQEIRDIRLLLKKQPEWMQISFEIAIHTGCRQAETQIEMKEIDIKRKTISFTSPKGGREKAFTVPLPAALEPLLARLHALDRRFTLVNPPKMMGKEWWRFFKYELKRPDLCFHCTRVTFVTRLARGGVPISAAMRLVNHSSTLVHQIYQRLAVDDVRDWGKVIAIPVDQPLELFATPSRRAK